MTDFAHIMALPLAACLILTSIHAYLGLHVIERKVIFVDLALAQIAVLGSAIAILLGYAINSALAYIFSLGFTLMGAGIFALTKFKKERVPHEAIIGIVYVVSAAVLLIILSFSGEGTEHIRQWLEGNILLTNKDQVLQIAAIYSIIGIIHFICREKFYLISQNSEKAFSDKINVRGWDFLFYATFGIVVTSSVRIAGVFLVFAYLVIPAVCAVILTDNLKKRLIFGWGIGTVGSAAGISVSYGLDLPTGPSIICVLGVISAVSLIAKR